MSDDMTSKKNRARSSRVNFTFPPSSRPNVHLSKPSQLSKRRSDFYSDAKTHGPALGPFPKPGHLCVELALLKVSKDEVPDICTDGNNNFVHLYRPPRELYFQENLDLFHFFGGWTFKATTGHGVRTICPSRPVINFFQADEAFAQNYAAAAYSRGFQHGVILDKRIVEDMARHFGYELANVRVCHPRAAKVFDEADYWRYDIGQYRWQALAELRYATVVRLAMPYDDLHRLIVVPLRAIVAWW